MPNSSQLAVKTKASLTLFNNLVKDLLRPLAVAGAALTLASDTVTVNPANGEGYYSVDTEASAAWDTLNTINGGTDGDIVFLLQANAARIVLLGSSGNIQLPPTGAAVLSTTIPLGFRYNSTASKWFLLCLLDPTLVYVHNTDASTLNHGDIVVADPTYTTAGAVGVKTTTVAGDYRVMGVIASNSILTGQNGYLAVMNIQDLNITGVAVWGHSFQTSTSAHYAMDTGGTGKGTGTAGFLLGTNVSGNAQIRAMIQPNTQYIASAQSIVSHPSGNWTTINSGYGTAISNIASSGANRLLLFFGVCNTAAFTAPRWGASTLLTDVQDTNGTNRETFAYLIPDVSTSSLYVSMAVAGQACSGIAVLLNGVNQSTPVGASADAKGTGTSVSVTIACSPGDLVIAGFSTIGIGSGFTINGRGAGQVPVDDQANANLCRTVVDSAIATGVSITFTWTLSTSATWDANGIATKSV